MFLDGNGPGRRGDAPQPPRRRSGQERVLFAVILFFVALMFVMPISLGTMGDIVHYLLG